MMMKMTKTTNTKKMEAISVQPEAHPGVTSEGTSEETVARTFASLQRRIQVRYDAISHKSGFGLQSCFPT